MFGNSEQVKEDDVIHIEDDTLTLQGDAAQIIVDLTHIISGAFNSILAPVYGREDANERLTNIIRIATQEGFYKAVMGKVRDDVE